MAGGTISRRLFVAGGGAALTARFNGPVQAEIATPVPAPLTRLPYTDAAYRAYKLASAGFDTMLKGLPYWLDFDVLSFANRSDAKDSIEALRDNIRQSWRNGSDRSYRFGSPKPVSVRKIGDEAHAWAVAMTSSDNDLTLAFVIARKDSILYASMGTVESGNPYPLLADQTASMVAREVTTGSITVDADGLHHGRLWDYLPTLGDLPEGYQLDEDIE